MHDNYSQEKQLLSNRAHMTYTIIHRRNSFKAIELARLILDRRLSIDAHRRACRFLMVSGFFFKQKEEGKKEHVKVTSIHHYSLPELTSCIEL